MKDPIAILEAAYRLDGDERSWLGQFLTVVESELGQGSGIHGWTFDASASDSLVLRTAVNAGVDARIVTSLFDVEQPAPLREILQRMLRTSAACTLSRAVQFLGNRSAYYLAQLEELGLADVFFVNAVDPSHLGCFLAAPSPR